jgi:hypothetical protein
MPGRQLKNTDAERQACEIRLRAERKAGQLLTKMKVTGERANERGSNKVSSGATPTLDDLGISRQQSSQWQRLGALSQAEFDEAIGTNEMPSTKGILRSTAEQEMACGAVAGAGGHCGCCPAGQPAG